MITWGINRLVRVIDEKIYKGCFAAVHLINDYMGSTPAFFREHIHKKNPRSGPGDFKQGFVYSMHACVCEQGCARCQQGHARWSQQGRTCFCVNLMAQSRVWRCSQQCRAFYLP